MRQSAPSPAELATRFQKGREKTGGRKKGAVNKATQIREISDLLLAAMDAAGDANGEGGAIGYLAWLFREHPRLFTSLLIRLLPERIVLYESPPEHLTWDEIRERLLKDGLPVPEGFPIANSAKPDCDGGNNDGGDQQT